tara:strand:- start:14 stop:721 length:708 start_codon:yes stop_codon:yes gene_type:complete
MNLLSNPSKMPCVGFNIPALKYCPAAQLLLKVKEKLGDLICSSCYACKGFYTFSNVKASLQARADFVTSSLRKDGGDTFVNEMSAQIAKKYFKDGKAKKLKHINTKLFRVHDSGDLFSVKYINAWKRICENFPQIRFWFPTREWIRESQMDALKGLASLPNVIIKPSALYLDEKAPDVQGLDSGTSVYSCAKKAIADGHSVCPATSNKDDHTCAGNNCENCFIKNFKKPIAYLAH